MLAPVLCLFLVEWIPKILQQLLLSELQLTDLEMAAGLLVPPRLMGGRIPYLLL